MSKAYGRKRQKKRIKRATRRIVFGVTFAGVVTVAVGLRQTSAGNGTEIPAIMEPIPIIQSDAIEFRPAEESPDVHILEETPTEPRSYYDVDFVPLPVPMTEEDQAVVFGICQDQDVSFPLAMAMIEQESQFDRTARSSTGDSGYMQINDVNADSLAELGFTDLYDLEQNVGAGVYMLKCLFDKYDGDTTFVLMAYNAGESGAAKQREAGIYETEYTVEILERAEVFSSYIDSVRFN